MSNSSAPECCTGMRASMTNGKVTITTAQAVAVAGSPQDTWDEDATQTPLGAYYRIDSRSIVDMQSAIFETHAVYVSADVHDGWDRVGKNLPSIEDAMIEPPKDPDDVGGHAFALVGYLPDGFIIQNSWGPDWGFKGFAI